MKRVRVSLIGATGYTGAEACALLSRHPAVELAGRYASGRTELADGAGILPLRLEELLGEPPDCAFLATPNETSAELAPKLLEAGVTVIDLSGAFRLRDAESYPRWYGFPHPDPRLLDEAVYGLTEWRDGELEGRRLVANPGCYATSVLLASKPLIPLLDPDQPLVCDAKSGVSGAGKRGDPAYSFAELAGNFRAYSPDGHRHEPEIRQELGLPEEAPFIFVPHLLPVVRGILSTLYVCFARPVAPEEICDLYLRAYVGSPFVTVRPPGDLPELKSVVGTPRAEIGFVFRHGGRRAVVISVLDNLLKGAASQAIQNFNRVFGFDEREGLA